MKYTTIASLLSMTFFVFCSIVSAARPDEPTKEIKKIKVHKPNTQAEALEKIKKQGNFIYSKLDFSQCETILDKEVFLTAYIGYRNLRATDSIISNPDLLTIGDYTLSANKARLWVVDVKNKKILYNTLVAHGQGTGEEYATNFSNIENSHQSSMGFYVTSDTYMGRNGYSLRLVGKDNGYNCRAMERAIVIHGAPYVTKDFIQANKRLGRSWGCPALPPELAKQMINTIKEGTVLYIHANDKQYLAKSQWINHLNQSLLIQNPNPDGKLAHTTDRDSTARSLVENTKQL